VKIFIIFYVYTKISITKKRCFVIINEILTKTAHKMLHRYVRAIFRVAREAL